jgi:hypothetical protein
MHRAIVLLAALGCVTLATPALADGPAAAPATQPAATQPSADKYQPLVQQLADDDPHVRNAATRALRAAGRAAEPALRAAATSPDPQVRDSAQMLLADLEGPRKAPPAPADAFAEGQPQQPIPGGHIVIRGGGGLILNNLRLNNVPGQVQVQMHVVHNGQFTRDVNVSENEARKVHIHEDNDGIKIELSENGKTTEYAAKNADELKEKQPDGYKLYEKYVTNGAAGQLNTQVVPAPAPAPARR